MIYIKVPEKLLSKFLGNDNLNKITNHFDELSEDTQCQLIETLQRASEELYPNNKIEYYETEFSDDTYRYIINNIENMSEDEYRAFGNRIENAGTRILEEIQNLIKNRLERYLENNSKSLDGIKMFLEENFGIKNYHEYIDSHLSGYNIYLYDKQTGLSPISIFTDGTKVKCVNCWSGSESYSEKHRIVLAKRTLEKFK